MSPNRMKPMTSWFVLCAFVFSVSAVHSTPELTLDDLRKLEIICFVPSYLPKGFRLQRVDITYDELHEEFDDIQHQLPLYSIVYSNDSDRGATFSIESAREGIGDRNIMVDEEAAEEMEIQTPLGPMYLIYRPKGKSGRKDEIIANWVSDAEMNAERPKARRTILSSADTTGSLRRALRSQSLPRLHSHFTPSVMRSLPRRQRKLPRLRFTPKFST